MYQGINMLHQGDSDWYWSRICTLKIWGKSYFSFEVNTVFQCQGANIHRHLSLWKIKNDMLGGKEGKTMLYWLVGGPRESWHHSVFTPTVQWTPPSSALTPPPHGLSPPPNQHLFVINTAECSTADNAEHLRSGKQNPLGLRRSEQEGDRGSQTVCEIDRQTEIWMGYKAPTLSPEAPSDLDLGLWQNHFACPLQLM